MRNWTATFSAVVAAGAAILAGFEWRMRESEARANARAVWERTVTRFESDVENLANATPWPELEKILAQVDAVGEKLITQAPPSVDTERVVIAREALAEQRKRASELDWLAIEKWEKDVRATSDNLTAARNSNNRAEKRAAVDAALKRTGELLKTFPSGANLELLNGVNKLITLTMAEP